MKVQLLHLAALSLVSIAFWAGACGRAGQPAPANKKAAASKSPVTSSDAGVDADPLPKHEFDENEFAESDRSRDPFRSYEEYFHEESKEKLPSQRAVILEQYSLDELKLIGIVQRSEPPMAMLVDPTGKGHTIRRGEFVGRAETVQGSGQRGTAYELNWRVDRIREADVVFVREDPANQDVPSATKVISLHPEGSSLPDE